MRRLQGRHPFHRALATAVVAALLLGTGCSVRKFAIRKLGDALSEAGTTYASDDDPELIRGALPFSLKLIQIDTVPSFDSPNLINQTTATSSFTSGVLVNAAGWNTLNYVALPFLAIAGSAALWLALRRRAAAAAA